MTLNTDTAYNLPFTDNPARKLAFSRLHSWLSNRFDYQIASERRKNVPEPRSDTQLSRQFNLITVENLAGIHCHHWIDLKFLVEKASRTTSPLVRSNGNSHDPARRKERAAEKKREGTRDACSWAAKSGRLQEEEEEEEDVRLVGWRSAWRCANIRHNSRRIALSRIRVIAELCHGEAARFLGVAG